LKPKIASFKVKKTKIQDFLLGTSQMRLLLRSKQECLDVTLFKKQEEEGKIPVRL